MARAARVGAAAIRSTALHAPTNRVSGTRRRQDRGGVRVSSRGVGEHSPTHPAIHPRRKSASATTRSQHRSLRVEAADPVSGWRPVSLWVRGGVRAQLASVGTVACEQR